ncbi:hypothetical protein [Pedobacter sp. MC2016-24]|uniref:hypothetical protein n=1 Tax=Pedobacter sp. MC2016-24 TaxID=2780090 RepID=UPI00187F7935|nr:hypothetical protein [Pedobacter sp. MC2016-24]MBE9599495.1 hypothetical protein [Pedobacter sp. MC2016-24]
MREIEIVTTELFKSLLEIDIDDVHFDLHNDYDCYSILFSKDHELTLSLKSSDKEVKLTFKGVTVNYMFLNLTDVNKDITTIDSIYRGRYEDSNVLREVTDDSRNYYYIEFYSGYTIELFARTVFFVTS